MIATTTPTSGTIELVHTIRTNGANNLEVLQAAGMGVAFEGKPLLLAKMAIQLNHTDLRGLLHLQGYKEHDFIANKI